MLKPLKYREESAFLKIFLTCAAATGTPARVHLILLRHAEKDTGGGLNPGLSLRGTEQSLSLVDLLRSKKWPRLQNIFVSPKRRTQETVAPLAAELKLDAEILAELDERNHDESMAAFHRRLRAMMDTLDEEGDACVLWCTHLDWIEEFRNLADSEQDLTESPYDHWEPAQYLVLELDDDLWRIVEFGRAP